MAAYVILVVLAAFGVLCALWAIFGFLLPGHRDSAVVCICKEDAQAEAAVHRHSWLYNAGFLRCPLILIDEGMSPVSRQRLIRQGYPVIVYTYEELHTLIIQERIHFG